MDFFITLPMSGINAIVTNHFKMFFRDMTNESFHEIEDR